jgi:SAM-dependent methyltransferase
MKSKGLVCESWFDHPEWFEIGFDDMTIKEADFFEAAFKKYCNFPVKRVLEPGCGSGRLITEMANRGYQMTGFDLSKPSLDYLRQRLQKLKLRARAQEGNMADFRFPGKFDAAFCPINSFRHLTNEADAKRHLESMAAALRPGGIYILGLHLAPPDCDPICIERWYGRRGRIHVGTTLRVVATDPRRRVERLRISVLVRQLNGRTQKAVSGNDSAGNGRTARSNGTSKLTQSSRIIGRLRDEFDYRLYTAAQIRSLFAGVPQLELLEVFDFWYELDDPQKLDNELSDAVFILRRR